MLSENAVRSLWTTGSLCNSKCPCMSVNCPWLYVVLSTALPGKSWINWAMAKGVATDFWLAEGGRRCARPDTTYPNVISPISATYLHNMPSKTIFRVLKKEKVTRFPGVVPSELLNWRGRVLSLPPAFDAQGNGVWKGAGTSGVSLPKPLRWLKPGISPQTLFGDDEILPSQTHDH